MNFFQLTTILACFLSVSVYGQPKQLPLKMGIYTVIDMPCNVRSTAGTVWMGGNSIEYLHLACEITKLTNLGHGDYDAKMECTYMPDPSKEVEKLSSKIHFFSRTEFSQESEGQYFHYRFCPAETADDNTAAKVHPSFNCAKASTGLETLICGDSQLSNLDSQLAIAYKAALEKSHNPNKLKNEQRVWLATKRNKCQDPDCLRQAYESRLTELGK